VPEATIRRSFLKHILAYDERAETADTRNGQPLTPTTTKAIGTKG